MVLDNVGVHNSLCIVHCVCNCTRSAVQITAIVCPLQLHVRAHLAVNSLPAQLLSSTQTFACMQLINHAADACSQLLLSAPG